MNFFFDSSMESNTSIFLLVGPECCIPHSRIVFETISTNPYKGQMFEHGHQYKRISPTQTKNPKRASKATRFSLHWTCTCDLHDTAPHNPRHLPISLLGASMHLTHISYPRQFDQRQFFFFSFWGQRSKTVHPHRDREIHDRFICPLFLATNPVGLRQAKPLNSRRSQTHTHGRAICRSRNPRVLGRGS